MSVQSIIAPSVRLLQSFTLTHGVASMINRLVEKVTVAVFILLAAGVALAQHDMGGGGTTSGAATGGATSPSRSSTTVKRPPPRRTPPPRTTTPARGGITAA